MIQLQLANIEIGRLSAALSHVSKKKKRKQTPIERLRAKQGTSSVFCGPTEFRELREEAVRKQQEKEQSQRDKVLRKEAQAQKKIQDEVEKQARRDARVAATNTRKAAAVEKKAAAAAAREAKRVAKHLQSIAKTASIVHETRPKQQGVKRRRPTSIVEDHVAEVVEPRKTRGGRIVKQSARLRR